MLLNNKQVLQPACLAVPFFVVPQLFAVVVAMTSQSTSSVDTPTADGMAGLLIVQLR